MKCLVFSDTHGNVSHMKRVLADHADAGVVFFLGDGLTEAEGLALDDPGRKWLCVAGNGDSSVSPYGSPRVTELLTSVSGKTVFLTHGHRFGVKGGTDSLLTYAKEKWADVILFGHTHAPFSGYAEECGRGMWVFNPGSLSRPVSGRPTYGILTIREGGILCSHGEI